MGPDTKTARILLVEDNEINREVATELLSCMNLDIETANDGLEAISKVTNGQYDLVLMDYLMPVMDGAKATSYLRSLNDERIGRLPIIALTANEDETEDLIKSGMNDCIIKPVTLEKAKKILLEYLPDKAVELEEMYENRGEINNDILPSVEGIDVQTAIANCSSAGLVRRIWHDYANTVDIKIYQIKDFLMNAQLREYRVEVHALKSSSFLIGAVELSKKFAHLEQLARDEALEELLKESDRVLEEYLRIKERLCELAEKEASLLIEVSNERLLQLFEGILSDADEMYLDGIDQKMDELAKCVIPDSIKDYYEKLVYNVTEVDLPEATVTCKNIIEELKN